MSTEQQENLDAILRQSAFPAGISVSEQRRLLRELTAAHPLPADVSVTAGALGGVPTAEITIAGVEPRHTVLYFHGGVYALGDAFAAADLAAQIGRRTTPGSCRWTTGSLPSIRARPRSTTPWPPTRPSWTLARPSGIAFAGDSVRRRPGHRHPGQRPRPRPAQPAAAYVMSPYADLTLAEAMDTKGDADALMSRENLGPGSATTPPGRTPLSASSAPSSPT